MKTFITKFERIAKKTLVAGSVVTALATPNVFAASGTTQVDITFPPLLILYYYDNIPITVDAASFAAATGSAPAGCNIDVPGVECAVTAVPTPTLTSALGQIDVNTNITGDATINALTTTINFDINNAWAVRSLGLGTLDATITQGAGDFVAASATSDLAGAGGVTSSLTLTPGANIGDLQFDVNLLALADPLSASDTITITVVPTP